MPCVAMFCPIPFAASVPRPLSTSSAISLALRTTFFSTASVTAWTTFCFASLMSLRTMTLVVTVAAAAPASEAPKVTGAAACAIANSMASAMSWAITAIFITMTIVATTWSTMASTSAASAASSR